MATNHQQQQDELYSLFQKFLQGLSNRISNGTQACSNCCGRYEKVSQEIVELKQQIQQLHRYVVKSLDEITLLLKPERKQQRETFKDNSQDEITGFSQESEQSLTSPTGTFQKRFSASSAKKEQEEPTIKDIFNTGNSNSALVDNSSRKSNSISVADEILKNDTPEKQYSSICFHPGNPTSKNNLSTSKLQKKESRKRMIQNVSISHEKQNDIDKDHYNQEETPINRSPMQSVHENTLKRQATTSGKKKMIKQRMNSKNFGKEIGFQDDNCTSILFSQTPPPEDLKNCYHAKENLPSSCPHSSIAKKSTRPEPSWKDKNNNNIYANPVVHSREERMKLKASSCDECDKLWRCLAQNDENRRQQLIQNCSKHRHCYTPPETPEFWYDVSFPDTETIPPESPLV
eukprot:jgi/Galph1/1091/GphlegSOOS_G5812.1